MKKLSALLLSSLILSLPACDSGDDEGETNATATDGTTDTDGTSDTASTDPTDPTGSSDSDSDSTTGDPTAGETGDPTAGETGDPTAGETGDPTGGGESTCQYRCGSDEDCFSNGMDIGLTCVDSSFCLAVCEDNADCVAQLSGWSFQPCDSNDACAAGPCVDLGDGTGGCATEPTEFVDCATLMQEEVEVTDIEGNMVTVCGNNSGSCEDSGLGANTCVIEGGVTGCEETGCPDGFTCGEDGACRCDNDEACGDGGVCNEDGACINPCADASECDDALPFDGGEYVCE